MIPVVSKDRTKWEIKWDSKPTIEQCVVGEERVCLLITTWLDPGFDKEELRIRVLAFGGENGEVKDAFGDEIQGSYESKPSFGDTPKSNQGFGEQA